ncbi:ribonuclease HIII [Staphylococcus warneri]|jgi:ribonuclease HIII|uniref:ribonuclease HIII n=1 Tax=Staphylococcus TaxID=1279 RepID=UPI000D1D1CA4|nr:MULTISPECIES: ribonuclease HIII [Staphylococcus]MBE9429687.1 ribonuclease HIII [Staphylococcus epidermidis]AXV42659.1 ribonuclease HIII [Staphylococcus sp. M0911]MCD8803736.1 ribonuclease HIII [Staphylococcus warneri]MCD8805851.1 ribonuclease HIII [Staphylococcus warneri]PTI20937.1 ribonuclease HIII [Staphylococcus warneri]
MANVVHKLTTTEIQSLMSKIKFDTSQLPQGMKARAKHNNAVINIYNSGKVMFQGKNAEIVAQQLLPDKSSSTSTSSISKNATSSIKYNQYNCIGSDEAGSGDYFGPLTVCAAYVTKDHVKILKELGVDDSKKLTDAKIVELAEQLVTFIPHSLLTLDNVKYNERQRAGWSQVKMKAVLHNQAIANVVQKIDTHALDYIVIDQFAERGVYQRYALSDLPFPNKTKFETKGESKSLAIAAASIISRYAFVKHMDQMSKSIKMDVPKGASNKVDLFAAKLIEKLGIEQLDAISKQHFKNREKAQTLVNKKYQ